MRFLRAVAAIGLAMTLVHLPANPVSAQASWLDAEPRGWNMPGQSIPAAPPVEARLVDPRCLATTRPAESVEEARVDSRGWLLVGPALSGWRAKVIRAASDFDGMCRPVGFQVFVFLDGDFAGTLSPIPMDSRSDGALGEVQMYRNALIPNSVELVGSFRRYTPIDPLCCPSGTATVTSAIDRENDRPVLRPIRIVNAANPMPSAQPPQPPQLESILTAQPWLWESFSNPTMAFIVENPSQYTIVFGRDGGVSIQADCNRALGTYRIDGSVARLTIGPATLALCPGDSRGEQMLRLLDHAASVSFRDGKLLIDLKVDGGTLVFAPAAAVAP